jgi:hypothetical protein
MSNAAIPKIGMMQWGKEVIALQDTPLPVLYFDGAPCLSHLNGVIGITLTVTGGVPMETGGVNNVGSVVAHLKCNIPAAMALRHALDQALLLAQPVENSEGKSN